MHQRKKRPLFESTMTYPKKLIEVALPLEAINKGSKPETENPFLRGHPRAIHNWWARTPLSVARAIMFAQMIDDPGDGLAPEPARLAREELINFVASLATWDATSDESIIKEAQERIRKQFNGTEPEFWDMFSGRASIPLEAQRLGLKVTSSDLNPVAVTIERALLEYPQQFQDRAPVHPQPVQKMISGMTWKGASGLAADIKWYGEWIRESAEKKLARLYPTGPNGDPIVAWLWARTVKCPNPACKAIMPLVTTFALSSKGNQKIWVKPKVDSETGEVSFHIRKGASISATPTKIGRGGRFKCLVCKEPAEEQYIKDEGSAGRMGVQLLAAVTQGRHPLTYVAADSVDTIEVENPTDLRGVDVELNRDPRAIWCTLYGLTTYDKLFTSRQLTALFTLADVIVEARALILDHSGQDKIYADAMTTYLACALSRLTDYCCALATWNHTNENISHLFQRQGIPMAWDFVESNPINGKLSFSVAADWVASALVNLPKQVNGGRVLQLDATKANILFSTRPVISTDPPYYDNIGYADLADFFYVWLRIVLRKVDPQTFATLLTPKAQELVASPYHHDGSQEEAEEHFRSGFLRVFNQLYEQANPDVPITVYYAFKQEEEYVDDGAEGRASTGWETMLEGLVDAGFQITGTWPVRTTKKARSVARGTNALASAIVIVARQRSPEAPLATRREFLANLKNELPSALSSLKDSSVAPVDMAQASIGPGMAVFSRYTRVLESDGRKMSVRIALQLINEAIDQIEAQQQGDIDSDTRCAIAWYQQFGMNEGLYGDAEIIARAMNTSVPGMEDAGILFARAGKVRLVRRDELAEDWDPATDRRITIWEVTQHLIHTLDQLGENATSILLAKVGGLGDLAHDLAYRLFTISERKGWIQEALAYNSLGVAWPEIKNLASSSQGQARQLPNL
jgi:putative DNA methylase